jgi:hypothetical protein
VVGVYQLTHTHPSACLFRPRYTQPGPRPRVEPSCVHPKRSLTHCVKNRGAGNQMDKVVRGVKQLTHTYLSACLFRRRTTNRARDSVESPAVSILRSRRPTV